MSIRKLSVTFCWLGVGLLAILGPAVMISRAQDVPPPLPVDPNAVPPAYANPPAAEQNDPNAEVMTRGPIHEAYAVPLSAGQTAGMIVPRQPPAQIDEVPPDMKPEGGNSVWIPGYWSWDDDRHDFLWVSGVWRTPPAQHRWMPGYWQDVPGQGYQWTSGYWMPSHLEEATYLPQPQATLENGPNSAAPGANYFWIQGHWQWNGVQYVWQPGYWAACQPDWIWVPATYAWTPRGWVFVPGYWDYPLARRGLVFSPVYFARPVVVYHPAVCLDVGAFSISLFARPAYGHYYFGDYYDDRYVVLGIRPWYYNAPHYGYDPLFTYYRWYHVEHMHEVEWDVHLVGWHDYYRTHPEMRPPHTLVEERRLLATREGMARPDLQQLHMARDIHEAAGRDSFVRLQAVSPAERAQIHEAAKETVRFTAERQQLERNPGGAAPRSAEKVSLTRMSTFKSASLPGAATPAVSRPAGAAATAGRPAVGAPAVGRPAAGAAAGVPPAPTAPGRGAATGPAVRTARDKDKDKDKR